jgi:hypothetical protein
VKQRLFALDLYCAIYRGYLEDKKQQESLYRALCWGMKIYEKRDLKREAELKATPKCIPLAHMIKGKHAGGSKGRI